jgi:hypothetical protein
MSTISNTPAFNERTLATKLTREFEALRRFVPPKGLNVNDVVAEGREALRDIAAHGTKVAAAVAGATGKVLEELTSTPNEVNTDATIMLSAFASIASGYPDYRQPAEAMTRIATDALTSNYISPGSTENILAHKDLIMAIGDLSDAKGKDDANEALKEYEVVWRRPSTRSHAIDILDNWLFAHDPHIQ